MAVRTKQLKYRDAFNLSKGAAVKLRTYLKDCVNRSPVWSDWIETNYSAPLQGNPGSQIENFHCVHYDWESLQCNWNPGKKLASNSNYELMFWHIELARPKTCSKYLSKNGINIGCVFQSQDLEDFTEFFVHVTGIPGLSPVQSSYFVLQLQDLVKPSAPEDISLTMTASDKLSVEWKIPKGKILLRCLRYEIQFKDEKDIWKTIEAERVSTITISKSNSSHLMCVRIRGKLNKYCANDGYWSDWSPDTCWKEPQSTYTNLLFYCIGGGILTLTGLCVIAAILHVISKRHWSKKLQHKAKQLVCDVEVSNVLS
ncbi:interleukin-13 receptor subunit alpha-2-like [Rhinophrynus dorsalis]